MIVLPALFLILWAGFFSGGWIPALRNRRPFNPLPSSRTLLPASRGTPLSLLFISTNEKYRTEIYESPAGMARVFRFS